MNPLAMYGIGTGVNALGGLLSGGGQDQATTYTDMIIPQQRGLLTQMINQYASGGGDYGLGASLREGSATLQNMLAQMGIAPGSGAHASALSRMIANAVQNDAQNRRQYGLALGQASPAMMNFQQQGGGLQRDWSNWQAGQTGYDLPYQQGSNKAKRPGWGTSTLASLIAKR